MPKLKVHSGAKKRFRLTATGLVIATQRGKRHGMVKRTKKFVRNARGTTILAPSAAKVALKYLTKCC